jgi:hypothetical protein
VCKNIPFKNPPRKVELTSADKSTKFIFLWKIKVNCYKRTFKYLIYNTMIKRVGQNKGRKNLDNF